MAKKYLQQFYKNFSLDSRSLALFRVCISILLLIDFLFTRLPYFTLFYTEEGISPTHNILKQYSYLLRTFSVNFLSNITFFQYILFFTTVCFLILLAIGYKTKWTALGCWIFVVSFFSKNPIIYNSGDMLVYLLLFWALFLPLGNHFSVDHAFNKNKEKSSHVFSINSCAFILQILMIYLFTYILKRSDIWESNQAVYYALMLDNFRTPLGDLLLPYPKIMQVLSYLTYHVIEKYIFFVFFILGCYWKLRMALIFIMCGFHFSLGAFLHLGFFSWICMVAWLTLLPSEFWDRLRLLLPKNKEPLTVYYDQACSFCEKSVRLLKTFLILPHVSFIKASQNPEATIQMEKKKSWLIITPSKEVLNRWEVFACLISYSPLFFYLAPVFRLRFFSLIGNHLYHVVSKNRNWLDKMIPRIQEQKPSSFSFFQPILSVFFFVCLIYVWMWNIRTVDFDKYQNIFPPKLNGMGHFFHLYQKWNVFSPPPSQSVWLILFGVRKKSRWIRSHYQLMGKRKTTPLSVPSKKVRSNISCFSI